MVVVLAVDPDGTAVRVTAYGDGAAELVAGWPTTTVAARSTVSAGPAPIPAAELVPVAHAVLASVTNATDGAEPIVDEVGDQVRLLVGKGVPSVGDDDVRRSRVVVEQRQLITEADERVVTPGEHQRGPIER